MKVDSGPAVSPSRIPHNRDRFSTGNRLPLRYGNALVVQVKSIVITMINDDIVPHWIPGSGLYHYAAVRSQYSRTVTSGVVCKTDVDSGMGPTGITLG